jgi:YceI-like domain
LLVFKRFGIAVLALILAACGAMKTGQVTPRKPDESVSKPNLTVSGRVYSVDEHQSELRILVYRAGPLARFGHNHVMVNRALGGVITLGDPVTATLFGLKLPLSGFVVDDAQARREEGLDFGADVPEDARSGTLQNMLSAAVLDAAKFPVIAINSVAIAGPQGAADQGAAVAGSMIATVAISVAGHDSKISVPFAVQSDSNRLSAIGSLEVRQSDLGLTPYSLMLGALQVRDAITIKFKIVAIPS